jgi:hypothetical protein
MAIDLGALSKAALSTLSSYFHTRSWSYWSMHFLLSFKPSLDHELCANQECSLLIHHWSLGRLSKVNNDFGSCVNLKRTNTSRR